jgi:hypothetical protein
MRKLLLLAVIAACGWAFVRNHPRYSVYRLGQALAAGDVVTVKRLADLNALVTLPVDALVAAGANKAEEAQGNAAAALVALIGAAITQAAKPVAPLGAIELERRIADRDLSGLTANFTPDASSVLTGPLQASDYGAVLTVSGTCLKRGSSTERASASVALRLSRVDGPLLGYPREWKVVGVDRPSLAAYVASCALLPP